MEEEDVLLNVSYGISNEETISVGEFEVEIWGSLEESLDAILKETISRFKLKNLKSINITIKKNSNNDKT